MSFPNDDQRKVISHRGKPLVVIAGPGTGKTRTLVERMSTLLTENPNREISFITFTRTSRRDTWNKLEKAMGKASLNISGVNFPRTSTLHKYAKAIVHHYASLIGRQASFSVLVVNKGERSLILQELITDLNLEIDEDSLSKAISYFRCKGIWPDNFHYDGKQIIKCFEALLDFYDTFDMEGLVMAACEILDIASDSIPPLFLQVDEYQDLNPIDQKFIDLIASHSQSQVVVVGDDAQSIYGFRHANYEGLYALWNSSLWEKVTFSDCHRLPAHILNAAQALIADKGYLGAQVNPKPDDGNRIQTYQCTSSDLQVRLIAHSILQLAANRTKQDGTALSFSNFLVLCPVSNFINITMRGLQDASIPSQGPSSTVIPDELWRLLLVLRMLRSDDNLAFRQCLPYASLSSDEISQIRRDAMKANLPLYAYCVGIKDKRIQTIICALDNLRGNINNLEKFKIELVEFPYLNIGLDTVVSINYLFEASKVDVQVDTLIEAIYEDYGLLDSENLQGIENTVLVTTLHSAKGLEADFVFCPWLNSNYLPMSGRDAEEERRVLYVALTRAKQDVVLTFHETFDPRRKRRIMREAMSPFLIEIQDHLQIRRVRANDLE